MKKYIRTVPRKSIVSAEKIANRQSIKATTSPSKLSAKDKAYIRKLFRTYNIGIADEWRDEQEIGQVWYLTFNVEPNNPVTPAELSSWNQLVDALDKLNNDIKYEEVHVQQSPEYSYTYFAFYKYADIADEHLAPSVDKYTLAGWYFDQDQSSLPELAEYCGVDYDDDMETDDVLDQITDEQFVDYILQSEFAEAFYDEFT